MNVDNFDGNLVQNRDIYQLLSIKFGVQCRTTKINQPCGYFMLFIDFYLYIIDA